MKRKAVLIVNQTITILISLAPCLVAAYSEPKSFFVHALNQS